MTRYFSQLIAWGCLGIVMITPVVALYYLINIDSFASLARHSLNLGIQWQTVTPAQWYSVWFLTMIYLLTGLSGLYFLRRAFANFARGELFNLRNSRDLRLFSILLFVQGLAKPVHLALSSVLLSLNHPAGQQIISISAGSDEIKVIALAIILWAMSDLLVKGSRLESENKEFI